jgi:hypothetical protein
MSIKIGENEFVEMYESIEVEAKATYYLCSSILKKTTIFMKLYHFIFFIEKKIILLKKHTYK